MSDALRDIASELTAALAPAIDAARSANALSALLSELGWTPDSLPQPFVDIAESGAELIHLVGDVESADGQRLISAIKRLVEAIESIRSRPDAAFPTGVDVAEFKATLSRDLLDFLIVEYLLGRRPTVGSILKLAGLIRVTNAAAVGQRHARLRREVVWSRLGKLITDPLSGFREAFDWAGAAPNFAEALGDLGLFLESTGLQLSFLVPDSQVVAFLNDGAQPPVVQPLGTELRFGDVFGAPEGIAIGIRGYVRPGGPTRPAGIALLPFAELGGVKTIDLTEGLALKLGGNAAFEGGVAITFAPGRPPEAKAELLTGTTTNPPEVTVGLQYSPPSGSPERVLIGAKDASRLAASGISLVVGAKLVSGSDLDVFVQLDLKKVHVVVKPAPDESDSFLATLLGPEGLSFESSFGLKLSNRSGLSFVGSGGLEASFPLHVQLGPIDLQALTLGLKPRDKGFDIESGVNVSGKLGPLSFAVERAGFKLLATFPDSPSGSLGPIDLSFAFKPPNGLGLSIDAGAVKGGGYLFFDNDRGEYGGSIELTISNFLSLKAIGLITTRMPDGSKGFSLLVIITAEFSPGLQLGYGFTLIGVGGLLGLNRTVVLDALAVGVRTGAVNGLMFPVDPVANAPRILSDLRAIFPPKQDVFLIGPMAKLGWGTPTLVSLALGVIIEIPGNVAILGVLKVVLPTEQAALLKLQVNFVGAIEFDKKRGWFFAALFESRVLFITLEGEMGMLIAVDADANFVLSVGGFHPRFSPPPLPFPSPRRISFDIVNTPVCRIRAEGYFAVTTNTAQFGARAELFFGFDAFSVEGHIVFDALMRFSPFYFIVEISAGVSLKAFGVGVFSIDLQFTLEGTTPWRAKGRGSIKLLFFTVSADFDKSFGEARDTTLPPIQVVPLISAEIKNAANWRTLPPAGSTQLVSLRKLELPADTLALHPLGTLEISQRAIPLGVQLDRVGAQKPADANRVTLGVKAGGLIAKGDAIAPFAPAQFKDLGDAQKLSAPAFEPMASGIRLGVVGNDWTTGAAVKRIVRYEVTTIDTNYRRFVKRFRNYFGILFGHFLGGNSASLSPLSASLRQNLQPFAVDTVKLRGAAFVVARASDNTAYSAQSTFASHTAAQEHLSATAANDPQLRGKLHVIPASELNAA